LVRLPPVVPVIISGAARPEPFPEFIDKRKWSVCCCLKNFGRECHSDGCSETLFIRLSLIEVTFDLAFRCLMPSKSPLKNSDAQTVALTFMSQICHVVI
jgi:hypothetical protein